MIKILLIGILSTLHLYAGHIYAVTTNQSMIESLNMQDDLNIEDIDEVFEFVLRNTEPEIVVYPSEGYYYFKFYFRGNEIKGNIRFGSEGRDKGVLSFVYYYNISGQERSNFKTITKAYRPAENYRLELISVNHYLLQFRDVSKKVTINQLVADKNFVATLESYGLELNIPMMDESGIRFYLSYHTKARQFYYINDMKSDYESYYSYKGKLQVGARSEFVYYPLADDALVLVGVSLKNIFKNNFFDGPFDQLPDAAISKVNFKEFLIKAEPELAGKISNQGFIFSETGNRVAIANYIEYQKLTDLNALVLCEAANPFECIQKSINNAAVAAQ